MIAGDIKRIIARQNPPALGDATFPEESEECQRELTSFANKNFDEIKFGMRRDEFLRLIAKKDYQRHFHELFKISFHDFLRIVLRSPGGKRES